VQNALEEVLTDWGAEWVGTGKSFDPQGGVCKSPSLVACTAGRKAAVDISAGKVVCMGMFKCIAVVQFRVGLHQQG